MRIVQVIEQAVNRVDEIKQFVHASEYLNNIAADSGIEFPCAFLVRPVRMTPRVVASGHIIEVARCIIFFGNLQYFNDAEKTIIVDTPDAQKVIDPKIEEMRKALLKFFRALQEDETTGKLTVNQIVDVTNNKYDSNLCGVSSEFTIELRMENPYPCPDEI
jgi:hypothetical protein